MSTRGKILYANAETLYDESLHFHDAAQLGTDPYDLIIVGAGINYPFIS